jgi:aryl-alcohol dehydrogenase-like predicted oxidoreductase
MRYRLLGKTGIAVSEIGLGCASYWGKASFSESTAIEIVRVAVANGVTLFDTGHSYSGGNAEVRLGRAIRSVRHDSALVVSTKAGTRIADSGRLYKDFSPEWIRKSCRLSLQNLGMESLGLFQLHGPAIGDLRSELIDELCLLKSEGLVRAIGVNSFDRNVLEHVLKTKAFDFVMLDYNILTRRQEDLIDRLYDGSIGVIAGSALANSLFSNRILKITSHRDLWYFARAVVNFREKFKNGFAYRFINQCEAMTGPQVAMAYVLANNKVSAGVFGTTSIDHLLENIVASDLVIPDQLMDLILKGPL